MRLQFLPALVVRAFTLALVAAASMPACAAGTGRAASTTVGVITPQAPTQAPPTKLTSTSTSTSTVTAAPSTAAPPATVVETTPPPQTYVVQAGDQLQRIAKRFGVDLAQLMTLNGIANADKINKGQTLIIPPSTVPGSPPTASTPAP